MDFPLPAVIRHRADQFLAKVGAGYLRITGRPPMPITEVQADERTGAIEVNPVNLLPNWAYHFSDWGLPGEYRSADGERDATVGASVGWLARAIDDLPLVVVRNERVVERHPLYEIMARPNWQHSKSEILYQMVREMIVDGNIYAMGLGNSPTGPVSSFQILTHQAMRNTFPNQDGDAMVYRIQTLSQVLEIPTERMAHLMWEVHPLNSYLGLSPLRYANPWLLLDRYAAEGAAGRLRSPVAGIVLQPRELESAPPTAAEIAEEAQLMDRLRGLGAGDPMIITGRFTPTELRGSQHQFDYSAVHHLCQAQIAAQLGVPPSVSQVEVGLAQTRIGAVMSSEMRLAYMNGALPIANKLATGLTWFLLPMLGFPDVSIVFESDGLDWETEEEKAMKVDRVLNMRDGGLIDDEQAKRMLGLDSLE